MPEHIKKLEEIGDSFRAYPPQASIWGAENEGWGPAAPFLQPHGSGKAMVSYSR